MRHEVQAIILAGGHGSRMTTLVGRHSKSLLPIGNFPMICYSLYYFQEAGFSEVTVIVANNHKQDFQKLAEQFGLKLKLDIASINTANSPGTLDALRAVGSKIKKSVDEIIVASGDLITDASLHSIMDAHRSKGAALTMLTSKQNQAYCRAQPPGPKSKQPIDGDVICSEEDSGRLLYYIAGGDYDDLIHLPGRIFSGITGSSIDLSTSTSKLDAHFYVMKRWLLEEILSQNPPYNSMDSLKAEVIPHIISEQFSKPDHAQIELSKSASKRIEREDLIKKYNSSCIESRFHHLSNLDRRACYIYQHSGFCLRVNTINIYWQINKQIHKIFEKIKLGEELNPIHKSADINPRAQVMGETLIGRGSQVDEKTNISDSVIGNHCRVKPLVTISNSLLFDYVSIDQRCKIENSIICASVEKPCTIKNSIVVDPSKIEKDGIYTSEILEANQDFTE